MFESAPSDMKITWRQDLGLSECVYLRRWVLDLSLFSIRLHHWLGSDDARAFHDHPWWFISIILKGGYTDISPEGSDKVHPGSIRFRRAEHQHTVHIDDECWSLLLTGPTKRIWGFWVNGKFRKRSKYFFEHGHHQCEDD